MTSLDPGHPTPDSVDRALDDVYAAGTVEDEHGHRRPIEPVGVSKAQGAGLRDLVASERCSHTLETGFGLGLSAAHIAAGLLRSGGTAPRHLAIDPTTREVLGNAGWKLMERLALTGLVELIEEESQVALPRLMSAGLRLDLAFVDGDHRFDPAFVDLYFVSRMVRPRGLIVVDDMWMPAVRMAVSFFIRNIDAELVSDALPGGFAWKRRRPFSTGAPPGRGDTAVLRMPPEHVERPWDHFVPF